MNFQLSIIRHCSSIKLYELYTHYYLLFMIDTLSPWTNYSSTCRMGNPMVATWRLEDVKPFNAATRRRCPRETMEDPVMKNHGFLGDFYSSRGINRGTWDLPWGLPQEKVPWCETSNKPWWFSLNFDPNQNVTVFNTEILGTGSFHGSRCAFVRPACWFGLGRSCWRLILSNKHGDKCPCHGL